MCTKRLIALAVACASVLAMALATSASATPKKAVMGWGDNRDGERCNGTQVQDFVPTEVPGLGEPLAISASAAQGGAVLELLPNRTVMACGSNLSGQLGRETTEKCEAESTCSSVPVEVPAFKGGGVEAIATGNQHSLALKGGRVWSWGENGYHQLGRPSTEKCGTRECGKTPAEVEGLPSSEPAVAIAGGLRASYALMQSGKVMAWGNNEYGQLGNGGSEAFSTPKEVVLPNGQPLENVAAIAAGAVNAMALLKNGTVFTWGGDEFGALGVGHFAGEGLARLKSRVSFTQARAVTSRGPP
jgi:alpha-tubulin suppressor-like RCC1 family protein